MKIARFFAVIFGIVGLVLMLGTTVLCLTSLDAQAALKEVPREAQVCAQELVDAIGSGDLTVAAAKLYGQPDFGAAGTPGDAAAGAVWAAFLDSVSCEFSGNYYATDSGIARKVTVTALNIPSVMENVSSRASALLTQRVNAATEMSELYDENNDFRADLVAEVMAQALDQAMAEDAKTFTREVTLNLTCQDGQWWVVPDGALMQVLSGGLA